MSNMIILICVCVRETESVVNIELYLKIQYSATLLLGIPVPQEPKQNIFLCNELTSYNIREYGINE